MAMAAAATAATAAALGSGLLQLLPLPTAMDPPPPPLLPWTAEEAVELPGWRCSGLMSDGSAMLERRRVVVRTTGAPTPACCKLASTARGRQDRMCQVGSCACKVLLQCMPL